MSYVCVRCVRCDWASESEGTCVHEDSERMGVEGEAKGVAGGATAVKCTV